MLHPHLLTALAGLITAASPMLQAARAAAADAEASSSEGPDIVTASPAQEAAMRLADAFAPAKVPVTIVGETGTGKTLLALTSTPGADGAASWS